MKYQAINSFGKAFNGKTPIQRQSSAVRGLPILKIKDIDENGHFHGYFESYVDQIFY